MRQYRRISPAPTRRQLQASIDDLRGAVLVLALTRTTTMSSQINGSGHTGIDPASNGTVTMQIGTAPIVVAAGTYAAVYQKTADSKLYVCDGVEADQNNFAGLLPAGNYAANAMAAIYPPNSKAPPLGTPIVGELYAKNDGSLVATLALAVPLLGWSQKVAKSTTAYVEVLDGQVIQREV